MIEVAVKVSNDEQRLTKRFTDYSNTVVASESDATIQQMIKDTKDSFNGEIEDIKVTIKLVIK